MQIVQPLRGVVVANVSAICPPGEPDGVLVVSFSCTTAEQVFAMRDVFAAGLLKGDFDFSAVRTTAPAPAFEPGATVFARMHDWDRGEVNLTAVVVAIEDGDRRRVKLLNGVETVLHVSDLTQRASS